MFIARPPAITAINITDICTEDFTVSWTAASNKEGLFYTVTLSSSDTAIETFTTMDTSHPFDTNITANTSYVVSIFSGVNMCSGIPNETMVTTLTVEEGVPQSELRNCYAFVVMYP